MLLLADLKMVPTSFRCAFKCVRTCVFNNLCFKSIPSLFIQVQLMSSDGRSGNFSSPLTMECSGSAPLVRSFLTIVMCVVMAVMTVRSIV